MTDERREEEDLTSYRLRILEEGQAKINESIQDFTKIIWQIAASVCGSVIVAAVIQAVAS